MEAIIYNNAPQEEALNNRLTVKIKNSSLSQEIKDGVDNYSFAIAHPVSGKVALIVDRNNFYWPYVENELTPNELNNIATLTKVSEESAGIEESEIKEGIKEGESEIKEGESELKTEIKE